MIAKSRKYVMVSFRWGKEDLATEFKSSAIYNIKGEKNDDVFKEEILGTIVAFINRGIEGRIYLGIDDYGKKLASIESLHILEMGLMNIRDK